MRVDDGGTVKLLICLFICNLGDQQGKGCLHVAIMLCTNAN